MEVKKFEPYTESGCIIDLQADLWGREIDVFPELVFAANCAGEPHISSVKKRPVNSMNFLTSPCPIGSMYGIYGNIYHQYTPNVSIYTIHGSYGCC